MRARNLHPQELKDLWGGFRQRVEPVIGAIGRIEKPNGEHVGTGFIVAEGLHRNEPACAGRADIRSGDSCQELRADRFQAGRSAPQTPALTGCRSSAVAAIHGKLDMVLFEIPKQGRPQVNVDTAQAAEGKRVVAIGYPAEDRRNNPLFLASVFQGQFGVRRAAVGEVLDGTETPSLFHDCSTTQGNSGSPLFQLDSGKVIGIYRSGFFMYRNEAVDGNQLQKFIKTAAP